MIKDKLILTDCDGVLLDWEWNFTKFMHSKGHKDYSSDKMAVVDCWKDIYTLLK